MPFAVLAAVIAAGGAAVALAEAVDVAAVGNGCATTAPTMDVITMITVIFDGEVASHSPRWLHCRCVVRPPLPDHSDPPPRSPTRSEAARDDRRWMKPDPHL